jgi:hypothetical protein
MLVYLFSSEVMVYFIFHWPVEVSFSQCCFFFFLNAENLLFYPAEHVIYGDYVYKIWDEEMIKYVLGFFAPENMRIDVISKSFNSQGKSFRSTYHS